MKVLPVLGKQKGVQQFWKELLKLGVRESFANPKYIVVLGGDGTMLGAQRQFYRRQIPFVGVGFGRVNFLLNRNIESPRKFYTKLQKNKWKNFSDKAMRVFIDTKDGLKKGIAFNDVYIKSTDPTGIIHLKLNTYEYDNVDVFGDGLIVASPQGSTAYNRNAGGTILPLGSGLWCVTGICTQNKLQTTVVQQEVLIKIKRGKAVAVTDNKPFRGAKEVRIAPSPYSSVIYFDPEENFEQRRYE